MTRRPRFLFLAAIMLELAMGLMTGPALACTTTIGVVMSLTGPDSAVGEAASRAVRMAFHDINEAGGVAGCELVAAVRDARGRRSVAVKEARDLIDAGHVPGLIGGIGSPDTFRVLVAVTAPALVPQISPGATSPALTRIGKAGKSNGIFFRTVPSAALQGIAAAQYAISLGYRRLAILHDANGSATDTAGVFAAAYGKLGGIVTSRIPYTAKQTDYAAEVGAALGGRPDALYLVGEPADGAVIVRAWIAKSGPQRFLLGEDMKNIEFVKTVGAPMLSHAFGISPDQEPTVSTAYFKKNFRAFAKLDPRAPGAAPAYDAAVIMGLAIAIAGRPAPAPITAAIRSVVDPKGLPVTAGPDGLRRALALIKAHKTIRYVGVVGPIWFDRAGDIAAPFKEWKIAGGRFVNTGGLGTNDMTTLMARLGQ